MRTLILTVILLLLAAGTWAQTTSVTGTITDKNGNPYAFGTASAYKAVPLGLPAGTPTTVPTSSTGLFIMPALSSPASYTFTICSPPLNIGPTSNPTPSQVCFSSQAIAISGASQDLSAQLNAIALQLGPVGSSGSIPGNAATATALQNAPAQCGANTLATGISTTGAAQCTGTPTVTSLTATNLTAASGITTVTTTSTGAGTHSGTETFTGVLNANNGGALSGSFSGPTTLTGDLLAKSGRPWYDVMALGAKNDNVTDDTAAIQAAVTAACATTYKGGTIYFPPGAGYRSANTGVSPITVSCDNLNFQGAGYNTQNAPTRPPSIILCPACTVPLFTDGGTQRFGFQVRFLGLSGNTASAGSTGISLGNVGDYTVENNFFDSFGGPAFVTTTGFSGLLKHNFAQNCLMQRPATVDTGCFDLGNADTENYSNFVTPSVPTAAGNIGTGHTYAWVVRGANGFFFGNMGEISQHGWLISGNFNTLIGNRAFLIQGNGFTVSGNSNILTGNKALDVSQNANGTFDGFLLSSAITLGGNILSENLVDNTGAGNGNNVRHAITDANSAGASEFNANKHSNNRLRTNLATGVLYNMTGAAPTAIQQPHRQSGDRGDASVTVQCGLDAETQVFQTALTANRTITFSSTGAYNGCRFRVIRNETATGAFNLSTVTGGSNATLALINQYADVEFLVGVWRVTAFGSGLSTTGSGQVALGTSPTLTTPTFTGLTNGTGLQLFNTATTCTTAATINTPCTTAAITLPVAYADTNYRVACQGLGPTQFPQLQTVTKSNTTFTITLNNLTAAAASYTSFDCHVGHN